MKKTLLLGVLFAGATVLMGCSSAAAPTVERIVTVPVVETRLIEVTREVTREVEVTVVVTATPEPTPAYVSAVNAPIYTLQYALPNNPDTLDPQQASDETSALVLQQLYEGLFNLRGDGSIVPAAATGYQVSADSQVYTVTLRSGMAWSDGQPVTAQNYVDGVCRLLSPSVGNSYYYLLTDIAAVAGARPYAVGDAADCKTVGVKALDDLNLQITLERPAAFLPQLLAMPLFWPAPPPAGTAITATAVAGPLTNGAFRLVDVSPDDHITLAKNPDYWNATQVTVGRIEFRIVPSLEQQLALYEAGDLQVAGFPAEATARIQDDPSFAKELHVLVQPGVSYLGINASSGPTTDVNFRKAIASAIDRRALIDDVLKQPWHVAAQTIIPPNIQGYQGDVLGVGYAYNPEEARRYLAEAGYGPDNPAPPIELWYNREGNNEPVFKAVAAMLEEAGIPVRLVSSGWEVYRRTLDDCNKPNRASAAKEPGECSYNLYRMGWVLDYADPSSLLDVVFSPQSAFQYTGWQSAEYEELLAQARSEPDEAKRVELYRSAERLLLNDAVVVAPLQYYDRTVLVKAGIVYDYPPFGAPNLQYWKLP